MTGSMPHCREAPLAGNLKLSFVVVLLLHYLAAAHSALPAQVSQRSVEQQAAELLHDGRAQEAEQLLRNSLADHPINLDERIALADLLLQAGRLQEAEQVLGEGVRMHPDSNALRMQWIMALAAEHKYKEAMANLRRLTPPEEPESRLRYYRLASAVYSGLGDYASSAHQMTEALRVRPNDEEIQLLTAAADARAGEWKACEAISLSLFQKRPAPQIGLLLLQAQLFGNADFRAALDSLRSLDLPRTQKLQLRFRSAELLASKEKHAEAIEELQSALLLADGADSVLQYNLAVEQFAAARYDQTLATLDQLRAKEDSAEIEDLAGDAQEKAGNPSEAVQSHRRAVALAPDQEEFRLSLGAELLLFQSYEEAFEVFQQAAQRFPESARVYVGLGVTDYYLEKYDDSVAAFLRADALDNHSGRALNYLGATQLENAAGPSPAAVDALCARADAQTSDGAAISWCGALLFRQAYASDDKGTASAAIHRLRAALQLTPENPIANCSLGSALEWTGRLREARHPLETCVHLRPDSVENHYRLCHLYQELGLAELASQQVALIVRAQSQQGKDQSETSRMVRETFRQPQSITRTQ